MPTVYIFDFDLDIANILCIWLEAHGCEVRGFTIVEDLLEQLSVKHPDCIILDCHYNKLCISSKLCDTIRQMHHYTGKLLITSTSHFSEKELQLCDATHFIAKPFDLFEILKVVREV